MTKRNSKLIIDALNNLYPNAKCELIHKNNFELLIAVILSAQTTDKKVNNVTSILFDKYDDAYKLSRADISELEDIIRPIGLYKNKAINIKKTSEILVDKFNGIVPSDYDDLISLKGVGRKTANIILNNCFDVPTFAVDTHVSRVSKRLGIANKDDDVLKIEEKLMNYFPKESWGKLHHQFIFFGRYKCKAISPICDNCPFIKICDKAS